MNTRIRIGFVGLCLSFGAVALVKGQDHQPPGPRFVYDGKILDALEFFTPHEGGNGRSCGTCHRPEDNFALTPATVEARYQLLLRRRQLDPGCGRSSFSLGRC